MHNTLSAALSPGFLRLSVDGAGNVVVNVVPHSLRVTL